MANLTIQIGEVTIPLKSKNIWGRKSSRKNFKTIHNCDNGETGEVGRKAYCKNCGEELGWNAGKKAYKMSDKEYIPLDDKTTEKARRLAEIDKFKILEVDKREELNIGDIKKSYRLKPQENAEKKYTLLKEAIDLKGIIIYGKFPYNKNSVWYVGITTLMSDRGKELKMLRLRNPNLKKELGKIEEEKISDKLRDKMLELLEMKKDKSKEYTDIYEEKLKEVVEKKLEGEEVEIEEKEVEEKEEEDLAKQLEDSIELTEKQKEKEEDKEKVEA